MPGQGPDKLFSGFSPVSKEAWENILIKELNRDGCEKTLIWESPDGIKVMPFYHQEDINVLEKKTGGAELPVISGNKKKDNSWSIKYDIAVTDFGEANREASEVINKGINAIGFILNEKIDKKNIDILLQNIDLNDIYVNFYLTGNSAGHLIELIKLTENLQYCRPITINGTAFKERGLSIPEELAGSLELTCDMLDLITKNGINTEKVANKIALYLSVGSNYFFEKII